MGIMRALFSFFLLFTLAAQASDIEIFYGSKREVIKTDPPQYPKLWQKVERIDPNSDEKTLYEGYDFNKLIEKIFPKASPVEIQTIAKDGYKLKISKETYDRKGHFLALKVPGKQKIFNKYFNTHVRWAPSYLLVNGKVASPYAVKRIELREFKEENPIVLKTPKEYQAGAKVFVRACAKCHAHSGFGGNKAPKMKFVINRWKRKKDRLGDFLRAPQEVLKRKIQMSAFKGTDKELEDLIKFLNSTFLNQKS